MTDTLKAVLLGIVQGLSEFLPISSSGHLVLFEEILNYHETGLAFEIFVHFGTLMAVLVVYRKDVAGMLRWLPAVPKFVRNGMTINGEEDRYCAMTFYIIVATLPVVVLGLSLKGYIEQVFNSPLFVLAALLVTGAVMWSSRYTRESHHFLTLSTAVLIGFAQAAALIPGISRSGSTIVAALWLGVNRETAARFSFLLSIPAILGATVYQFKSFWIAPPPAQEINNLLFATIAAAVSGYLAILWLLNIIRKQKLEWFGVYCAIVGVVGIALLVW